MKQKLCFSQLSCGQKSVSIILLSASMVIAGGHGSKDLMSAHARAAKADRTRVEKPKVKAPKAPKASPKKQAGSKPQPVMTPEVLADLQVSPVENRNHLVRLQATGPLAFDRVPTKNPRQVLVRLYGAKLGALPDITPPPFGTINLIQESDRSVLVDLNFFSPSQRAAVAQGGNPNTVEIRVRD